MFEKNIIILFFFFSLIFYSCSKENSVEPKFYNYFPINLNDTFQFNYLRADISSTPVTIKYSGVSTWHFYKAETKNDSSIFYINEQIEGNKITETIVDDPNNWHVDTTYAPFTFENLFVITRFDDSISISKSNYYFKTFKSKFTDFSEEELKIENNHSNKFYLKLDKGINYYFSKGVGGNNYTNYELVRIY